MKKKILLLSGYDASSHRYWRNSLAEKLPEFEWTQLALADRHFYWRVRGNSLSFAFKHQQILNKDYDLLIVTSMVDLSSLRGFCPSLSNIPTIVYFHENQFAYPITEQQQSLVNVQITSIYTALCGEQLLFNSHYNLDSFISGATALLKRMPDLVPKGLPEILAASAQVIPVPVKIQKTAASDHQLELNNPPHILWNHRWEYDKQPEVFFGALSKLKQAGYDFRLHLLGQSFRKQPDCFEQARIMFKHEIENYGFQTKQDYESILSRADIVVSSSLHDFQGLSLQEGISYGCTPVAPDRVAYPEYVPETGLYELADTQEQEIHNLFVKLKQVLNSATRSVPNIDQYSFEYIIPLYRDIFNQLINSNSNL